MSSSSWRFRTRRRRVRPSAPCWGAPLIGATAAYGMAIAMRDEPSDAGLDRAYAMLIKSRPTAINLKWALDEMIRTLRPLPPSERAQAAYARAGEIAEEDVATNRE